MSDSARSSTNAHQIISVVHECADGWHTFTSKEMPGLFVCGQAKDLEELYEGLPTVIAELARADLGLSVDVRPEQTFSSYRARLPVSYLLPVTHYSITNRAA